MIHLDTNYLIGLLVRGSKPALDVEQRANCRRGSGRQRGGSLSRQGEAPAEPKLVSPHHEPCLGSSRREEAQTFQYETDQSLVTSAATVQGFKAPISGWAKSLPIGCGEGASHGSAGGSPYRIFLRANPSQTGSAPGKDQRLSPSRGSFTLTSMPLPTCPHVAITQPALPPSALRDGQNLPSADGSFCRGRETE